MGSVVETIEISLERERTEEQRYVVYRLVGGEPVELCATSRKGLGMALATLRDEEEFGDDDRVGLLDCVGRRWIVNPWAVGR